MYKVLSYFTDLQDNRHAYNAGDIFPRRGLRVSEERIKELSTNKNRLGKPLIALIPSEKSDNAPKTVLSDVNVEKPVQTAKAPKKSENNVKKTVKKTTTGKTRSRKASTKNAE